jgi:toxin-antitoxin system PIN domain toxin
VIAIDTNLLIYAHRRGLPEHRAAAKAIRKASEDPRGWGIALASIAEFWSVVTHPSATGQPSTAVQVRAFLDLLRLNGGARLWYPRDGFADRLVQLASDLDVRGAAIFDLQIALTAFENGAEELWSHDRSFTRIPGLRLVDPLS